MSKIKRFFRQTGLTKAQLISSLLCYFLCFALFLGIVVIWNPLSLSSAPTEDTQAVDGPTNTGYWTDSGRYDISWYNNPDTETYGDGSAEKPYKISTADQLAGLSYLVYNNAVESSDVTTSGSTNYIFSGKYFEQTANIDLLLYYWQPIGIRYTREGTRKYNYFSGSYDGGGHTVSGIFTPAGSSSAYSYQGLFGYIYSSDSANPVSIQNLGVIDSLIQGGSNLGGVVGYAGLYATITNCYNTGSVTSTATSNSYVGGVVGYAYVSNSGTITITNCYNTGDVNGSGHDVGGVVGYAYASPGNITITNCYNTGAITGSGSYVGGVVGYAFASSSSSITITNCYNTGTVTGSRYVGGVVGYASSSNTISITNCYNTGSVTSTATSNSYVGGVVGRSGASSSNTISITNCYNTGSVAGSGEYVGGVVGYAYVTSSGSPTITNCYYGASCKNIGGINGADRTGQAEYSTTLTANSPKELAWYTTASNWDSEYPWDFDYTWVLDASENDGYPNLTGYWTKEDRFSIDWYTNAGANVGSTADNPYIINSAEDLAGLSWLVYTKGQEDNPLVSGTDYSGIYIFQGKYFKQTVDIDLSEYYWQPIGIYYTREGTTRQNYFSGSYDGGNHTVSGIFTPAGSSSAYCYQGLFGYVSSSSSNPVTIQNIGITNSFIQGYEHVGGVVGYASFSSGTITITNCYNTGSISGLHYVGGVAGEIHNETSGSAIVKNCYNTGAVNATGNNVGGVVGRVYLTESSLVISNSYNTASISSPVTDTAGTDINIRIGGIIGESYPSGPNSSVRVVNSFSTGVITGRSMVGGAIGVNIGSGTHNISNTYYSGNNGTLGSSGSYLSDLATLAKTELFFSPFAGRYVSNTSWSTYWAPGEGTAWDFFKVWKIDPAQNNGYPIFRDEGETVDFWTDNVTATSFGGGNGKAASPYLISTPQHLALLAKNVNEGTSYENTYFRQTANISLAGHLWLPIGQANGLYGEVTENYFSGSYDGGGHTVSGITTTMMLSQQGLFGAVSGASASSPAVIENVTVSNSNINGYDYVAGIAGYAQFANFDNCMNGASVTSAGRYTGGISGYISTVTIENCYNLGTVTGQGVFSSNDYEGHGGIAGYSVSNASIIDNCFNYGAVQGNGIAGYSVSNASIIDNCFNYGAVQGNYHVAGILGRNNATITNCYNFGDISGNGGYAGGIGGRVENYTRITNCHNRGNISSTGVDVGGICGLSRAIITFTTSVGTLTGADNVGGIVGRAWQDVTITNSYFSGTIATTGANVAGILGTVDSNAGVHTITLSYNYAEFSTTNASVKGILGSSDSSTGTGSTIQYCAAIIDGITVADIQGGTNVTDSNSYCVAGTNKELSSTTSGMDGNFAYISNFKGGKPIPLGIFHILDFGTKTGIANRVNAL